MKPVKNTLQSMFEIGKTYQILGDNDDEDNGLEITIVSISPCDIIRCFFYGGSSKGECEGIRFRDESTDLWCGIPRDFKEVKE